MSERAGDWILGDVLALGDFSELRTATPAAAGATVAVKRLHTHAARDPALRALFGAEAALTCSLPPHPHLVRGLASELDGDRPWLALDLLDGPDLRATLGTALPRATLCTIISAAARACAHLHDHGWVHGDVGPANLVLTASRGAVLCDLGIARRSLDAGPVRGTAAYMAPEQVRGLPWSPALDVFALGTLSWELTTGTRLFHRGPAYLSMAAVVESSAPPLSDPFLAPIVAACLAKDPAARPTAAALADALSATGR